MKNIYKKWSIYYHTGWIINKYLKRVVFYSYTRWTKNKTFLEISLLIYIQGAYDLGLMDTPHPVCSAKLSIKCQVGSWMGDHPSSTI